MREAAGIVAPAISDIERSISAKVRALADADRTAEGAIERQRRAAVELGSELIRAKKQCKHGEWLPLLQRCGIASQRASECMRLAGWVEENLPPGGNLPTQEEAGVRKRDREPKEPRAPHVEEAQVELASKAVVNENEPPRLVLKVKTVEVVLGDREIDILRRLRDWCDAHEEDTFKGAANILRKMVPAL